LGIARPAARDQAGNPEMGSPLAATRRDLETRAVLALEILERRPGTSSNSPKHSDIASVAIEGDAILTCP
jgi:hypothetical protein